MSCDHIFISHASKDDAFVKELRLALEGQGLTVWADSRNLRGGNKLKPEINKAIEQARQVIVVISPNTVNSPWVLKEISKALKVEKKRKDDGYRVIPLLLPGIEPSALALCFAEEPVGVRVELKPGALSESMADILAALGGRLPTDREARSTPPSKPVEELLLKLGDPEIRELDNKRRASATAELIYEPADAAARRVESNRFTFIAPLGPIEADDLRWYLEEFFRWPIGVFKERADRIETELPQWGKLLYDEAAKIDSAREVLNAWENAADGGERRFSVSVDSELPEETKKRKSAAAKKKLAEAREAASVLLSLPWELLHDGRGFLFHGGNPVRVRRRLPNRHQQKAVDRKLPIRVLLVSPRPEQKGIDYIDHRVSAKPLVEAIESLGDLATLTVLTPPTFQALQEELTRAAKTGTLYDIVHFDGHGVYDRRAGLGALCFEDPNDTDKLEGRAMQLIYGEASSLERAKGKLGLAEVIRDHRIPLVFLEACQSAQIEDDPTGSVAASLLNEGVTSVVAMTHSVLVETARRFVTAFYHELARGARIGTAMIAGQQKLQTDTYRGQIRGAGELRLQDWFVPVLFQEEQDPRLITQPPSEQALQIQDRGRRLSLGALPGPPAHRFIGRSRELLALERLLQIQTAPEQSYVVVRGQGGEGKTTLAVELARWLVRTNRFLRAAFVSFDPFLKGHSTDPRGVLIRLGQQLLPEGDKFHVGPDDDLGKAQQPLERALSDHRTLIVLDNLESVLPEPATGAQGDVVTGRDDDVIAKIFDLCRALLRAHPATRIVFTSRESLPAPFDHRHRETVLGALSRDDAIELVSQVMEREGRKPKHDDAGNTPQEITELVEAVNRHARALVLLTPEISVRGVRATTENLHRVMAELHAKHPGDRENSLYASVELSLRRLPAELREQARVLGVFHGGANIAVLHRVLGLDAGDVETVQKLSGALIEVGLAEAMPYGHLRLDPALPAYLLGQMSVVEQEQARSRWVEGMRGLTAMLYRQKFQDAQLAAQLTLLELPNLLALLAWAQGALTPEEVIDLAGSLESLLARLGAWSHTQFNSLLRGIERMMEQGRLPEARAAAEQLLQRALAAGEAAYTEAAYDIAMAHNLLGQVLSAFGAAEEALPVLAEASERFRTLASVGDTSAGRMAAVVISRSADCLRDLGRYDEAAAAYEEGIRRAEKTGNRRQAAAVRGNLGTVRSQQKRYDEALESYLEALRIFESLGEPGSVAVLWHQIPNRTS